jgi:hypothetical protein
MILRGKNDVFFKKKSKNLRKIHREFDTKGHLSGCVNFMLLLFGSRPEIVAYFF